MSRATNSERSPLLRIQSRQSDAPSFSIADVAPSTFQITAVCLLLVAAHQAASSLAMLAAADLNEAAVCRSFHGHVPDPTNGEHCRELTVHSELANLLGVEAMLAMAMSILAPIPIGLAADRYGRRPLLVLALVGSVLNIGSRLFIYGFPQVFPLRLIWLSTSFELLTGGGTAFSAIIYTILTDVTSRAQRSTSFFYLAAANILATQTGRGLMDLIRDKFGPWAALFTAFGSFVFVILCALCIPETMHLNKIIYNEEAVEEESATQTTAEKIRAAVAAAYKQLTASMTALFCRNKTLDILLLTVLVMELESHSVAMLPLYIDYRYSKTISINAIENLSHFILNAMLLPLAAHALLHFNFSARRKDTTFARWGVVAAAIGLLGIGLAPGIGALIAALVVNALIAAYNGGILGLLSQLTGEEHLAAMFATTRVLATLGSLLGEPLFYKLFQSGSNIGKAWSGLSYIVVGCTYILVAAVVFVVTSGAERGGDYDEQD